MSAEHPEYTCTRRTSTEYEILCIIVTRNCYNKQHDVRSRKIGAQTMARDLSCSRNSLCLCATCKVQGVAFLWVLLLTDGRRRASGIYRHNARTGLDHGKQTRNNRHSRGSTTTSQAHPARLSSTWHRSLSVSFSKLTDIQRLGTARCVANKPRLLLLFGKNTHWQVCCG